MHLSNSLLADYKTVLSETSYLRRTPEESIIHKSVVDNAKTVMANLESVGKFLPQHITSEFEEFIQCGVPGNGIVRIRCNSCKKDEILPFSCKCRGICSSCGARRMSSTAANFVDNILPEVPVRQWVLSFPMHHRHILGHYPELLTPILKIFTRAIDRFYLNKAKAFGLPDTTIFIPASMTVIQRFGGALNFNPHFHSIYTDGVFFKLDESEKMRFYMRTRPSDNDIISLSKKIRNRINRFLRKKGFSISYLDDERKSLRKDIIDNFEEDSYYLPEQNNLFGQNETTRDLISSSISKKKYTDNIHSPKFKIVGGYQTSEFTPITGEKTSYIDGYSLHANVSLRKNKREDIEKLVRYISRPTIATKRLEETSSGMIRYRFKTVWSNGATHVEFSPEEFVENLIALIPPQFQNTVRYHGAFAPNFKYRSEVVKRPRNKRKRENKSEYWIPWSELLKRVFGIDIRKCKSCGAKLRVISVIFKREEIVKILDNLKIDSKIPSLADARSPPQENMFSFC